MSIIIDSKKIEIPGLTTKSWQDGISWIKEITDHSIRSKPIQMIVCHTHIGKPGNLLPGMGPGTGVANALVRYQVNTQRSVSWDFTTDNDGVVYCQNDPTKKVSWQASQVNGLSLGFEMVQTPEGDLYEGQIKQVVLLIDALTCLLGIQRQIPWNSDTNAPKVSIVKRIEAGGMDVCGVIGHRHVTTNRGPGDPGDFIFLALKEAGYELFDINKKEDLTAWKDRQKTLGLPASECTGVPTKKTCDALKASGKLNGMYVSRPVDSLIFLP